MNELAEAFLKQARQRKDVDWVQRLCEVVRLAVWPFDTGDISVSRYEWGSFALDTVFRVDADRFPMYPFQWKIDERQVMDAYFPEEFLFMQMAPPLFNHYRYRPSLPVDDHIILGED